MNFFSWLLRMLFGVPSNQAPQVPKAPHPIKVEPRQLMFGTMGSGACFVLTIVHIAELTMRQYYDAFIWWREAVALVVNVDGADHPMVDESCFVWDSAAFLSMITGKQWLARNEPSGYQTKPGEFEVLEYRWQKDPKPAPEKEHFVNGDGKGGIENDPYGKAATVANGYLYGKTIFWLKPVPMEEEK